MLAAAAAADQGTHRPLATTTAATWTTLTMTTLRRESLRDAEFQRPRHTQGRYMEKEDIARRPDGKAQRDASPSHNRHSSRPESRAKRDVYRTEYKQNELQVMSRLDKLAKRVMHFKGQSPLQDQLLFWCASLFLPLAQPSGSLERDVRNKKQPCGGRNKTTEQNTQRALSTTTYQSCSGFHDFKSEFFEEKEKSKAHDAACSSGCSWTGSRAMSVIFRCAATRLELSKTNGPASFMGVFCPSPMGAKVAAARAKGAEEVGVADRAMIESGKFLLIGALVEAMMGTGCDIEPREGPASTSELESVPEGF